MQDAPKNTAKPVYLCLLTFLVFGLLFLSACTEGGNTAIALTNGGDTIAEAEKLSIRSGCSACHSYDGKPRPGPTWQGLYGSERPLSDGTTVVANEKYLRQAITDPDSQVPQGFSPGMMPTDYGEKFSEEQVDMLVEFIKKLK